MIRSKRTWASRWFPLAVLVGVSAVNVALLAADPAPTTGPASTQPVKIKAFKFIDDKRLHNVHVVVDGKVISGAQPDDEAAFKALSDLGIKTIVSVDGAQPDVDLAKKYGMRYIHLPISYDKVPDEQGKMIAKALNEFSPDGAVYVHCHHGKHRSAAATAVACVSTGLLKPEQADSVLETFGTGANYKGLWKSAREAKPIDPAALAAMKVEWIEKAQINDTAAHMVKVDMHWDHLRQVKAAGWQSPPDHPDLNPPHEALQLQEHFTETSRLPEFADRPEDYRKWMKVSDDAARDLQTALAAKPVDTTGAEAAFKTIAASCVSCHKAYRD